MLLERVASGDRGAFGLVHHRYWNNIYNTSLSYLKSPEWAQDIVQDVFLKLWEKRAALPGVENFPAYLYVIVRNELVSALRKKWDKVPLKDSYNDVIPSDIFSPEHHIDTRKLEEALQNAVRQLSPQQRQIFRMTREMGLSHAEIALQLGIDKRTVGNHATAALNRLRHLLQDHPDMLLVLLTAPSLLMAPSITSSL